MFTHRKRSTTIEEKPNLRIGGLAQTCESHIYSHFCRQCTACMQQSNSVTFYRYSYLYLFKTLNNLEIKQRNQSSKPVLVYFGCNVLLCDNVLRSKLWNKTRITSAAPVKVHCGKRFTFLLLVSANLMQKRIFTWKN